MPDLAHGEAAKRVCQSAHRRGEGQHAEGVPHQQVREEGRQKRVQHELRRVDRLHRPQHEQPRGRIQHRRLRIRQKRRTQEEVGVPERDMSLEERARQEHALRVEVDERVVVDQDPTQEDERVIKNERGR